MKGSFWGVLAIAIGIAAVALVRQTFTSSLGLVLIALLVIGAVYVPAGLLLGGVALFYLVLVHGRELFGRFTAAISHTGGATA
jgi:hypothetical protein